MNLLEPGVFWSDILLAVTALVCGLLLRQKRSNAAPVFIVLAVSTTIGAFYHGLINTTTDPLGKLMWIATLLTFIASSLLLIKFAKPRISTTILTIAFFAYAVFAIFISEKFLWGLLIQAVAIAAYGFSLSRPKTPRNSRLAFAAFLAITIVAVVVQQAKITFGLPMSHNTIFHLIELPAIILLYKSILLNHAAKK